MFFVIRMYEDVEIPNLPETVDPDPPMSCDLMEGRDAFLTLARNKHWEFSSLRRAKYSTMCLLFDLHNQGQDRFVYSCNLCKRHVETRYHCSECEVRISLQFVWWCCVVFYCTMLCYAVYMLFICCLLCFIVLWCVLCSVVLCCVVCFILLYCIARWNIHHICWCTCTP